MELKYKFNTLEEVKLAIEKWFKDCGFDNKKNIVKQTYKLHSELGELADAYIKGNKENVKSEFGDCIVVLTGLCLMDEAEVDFVSEMKTNIDNDFNQLEFFNLVSNSAWEECYQDSFVYLAEIADYMKLNVLECATIAYNKIQGRLERGELKVVNGTVVKSGK